MIELNLEKMPTHDPLMLAIIWAESRGDPWSCRFEPTFAHFNNIELNARKNGISRDTERNLQQMSFGLCHIMGATARDLGFRGQLTELFRPEINIKYADAYMKRQLERYNGDVESAISAYNMGTAKKKGIFFWNRSYVEEVMLARHKFQNQLMEMEHDIKGRGFDPTQLVDTSLDGRESGHRDPRLP